MGHSHSQPTPLTLPPSLTNNHPLPTRISAAYQKSWTKITILLHDASTPTNNPTTPTYTITLPQGWYGAMTMHATNPNNPDPDSATPLAKADPAGRMRQDFAVGLPALGKGGVQRAEVLRYVVGWRHEVYWFAMAVGGGGGSSAGVERFEWRRSRGGEVKGVEGGSGWGWKLVRVGGSGGSGGQGNGYGGDEGGGWVDERWEGGGGGVGESGDAEFFEAGAV
ncbi:hypothetical protein CHGG_00281 [Chaetomium globosum CBS 148.51]|uniref:Uncharacterized protein n=1 Tax=Chaetomium globosum (strain ATCC 6205 / CBS 148.51 / DSM 1962 / NBRC 6347 / NRRL 1970) TaxID=306901 RepID=Q2HHM3_CHAGB|nr:uncharacterized protein CHGG_00281 [Chaetomium globosum CBS 148.51]EAQ92046.1 hypothetical protein CHGG_00281 [Chaetomium globosum CBS 148.51]